MNPSNQPEPEVALCKGCNTIKYLNGDELCGRCVAEQSQPDSSLREQLYHVMGFCPRDDHKCDWSPFLTYDEKLDQLVGLFEADESAAVAEAAWMGTNYWQGHAVLFVPHV